MRHARGRALVRTRLLPALAEEREDGHRESEHQLDADLHVVDGLSLVHHRLRETREGEARDELQVGAVQHSRGDLRRLDVRAVAADDDGHSEEVQEDQDETKDFHTPEVSGRSGSSGPPPRERGPAWWNGSTPAFGAVRSRFES